MVILRNENRAISFILPVSRENVVANLNLPTSHPYRLPCKAQDCAVCAHVCTCLFKTEAAFSKLSKFLALEYVQISRVLFV